jgi:hypothetical protein
MLEHHERRLGGGPEAAVGELDARGRDDLGLGAVVGHG